VKTKELGKKYDKYLYAIQPFFMRFRTKFDHILSHSDIFKKRMETIFKIQTLKDTTMQLQQFIPNSTKLQSI